MEYRKDFGCGFESFDGQGTRILDAKKERLTTCPQYLSRLPFVVSCYDFVPDFRDNRLGSVMDFPHATYCYLRVISAELDEWQRVQQERLMVLHGSD